MSTKTESLRDLYVDVTGEKTVTETQREEPSHAPIEAGETDFDVDISEILREDGLDDAVEGAEVDVTVE